MKLRSNLNSLLELDLNGLIAVQRDITRLIELKVDELQSNTKKNPVNRNCAGQKSSQKNATFENKENVEFQETIVGESDYWDSQDYILTQFDNKAREKSPRKPYNEQQILQIASSQEAFKKTDLSSPLKESQPLEDSVKLCMGKNLNNKGNAITLTAGPKFDHYQNLLNENNTNCNNHCLAGSSTSVKDKNIDSEVPKREFIEHISFNKHPLNKRAWILEDFKRNENANLGTRGRKKFKTVKLHKFYAKAGLPPDLDGIPKAKGIINGHYMLDEGDSYKFDNLRERSNSPPGYGRLDFPTTQERFDDKQKSQEIIFRKTRERFIEATCTNIPTYERGYIFKSDHLNQLVDDGAIEWNEEELEIFTRK